MRLSFLALLIASPALAQADEPAPPPRVKSSFARGEKILDAYLRDQVRQIESDCLTNLTTKEAWEKKKPELRREFFDMMGLWPRPPKTDLKATITGRVEGEGYTVEKLHFQAMPGLYVTANLYLPATRKAGEKFPTILYVCGHGNVLENGVSYGSKVFYQYHPAWFAAHGYVCLIFDTLELGEIQGLHHGTYREGMWWWHSRGYTPAGVELWKGIRALDYLESRPEVDAKRIGITGRSGGGAYSWWIAAADERIQAAVPVAGIADLRAHVVDGSSRHPKGVIAGHCDCMYFVNTYRWDFAEVAALIAPRPLLLGNSDADDIFPVPGYRRLAEKVSKVYALYGAEEKFQLLETKGPHRDTPELRVGINRWMNRWLKDDTKTEVKDDLPPRLKPEQLKVFAKLPEDRINEKIQETFVKEATIEIPAKDAPAWWKGKEAELRRELQEKVFAGWPRDLPPLAAKLAVDVSHDSIRLRAIDFVSESQVPLRLFVMTSAKV
ncbi:MAG TPA: prolyl oligopeptidase family serine peptidase, partial [Gemmata sp.]|nr:prolyl oligopeptidase family serine peptidase [Gemmata sp.]